MMPHCYTEASEERLLALILVVDDEPTIRTLVRAILEAAGYDVVEAAGGQQALAIMEDVQPSLLLTDIVMPGMGGLALAAETHRRLSWVPVLFMSGFASNYEEELTGAVCLNKPFTPAQLLASISSALGSSRGTAGAPT
jgi:two-component system OmpR family response regulator